MGYIGLEQDIFSRKYGSLGEIIFSGLTEIMGDLWVSIQRKVSGGQKGGSGSETLDMYRLTNLYINC